MGNRRVRGNELRPLARAMRGLFPASGWRAVCVAVALLGGQAALAANHEVGPGKAYATLEDLRTSGAIADGDTVTLFADDASLTTNAFFSGLTLTFEADGAPKTLTPSAGFIAVDGGAIYNETGTVAVTDGAFSGNSAYEGGAIYNINGTVEVTDGAFSGNSADWDGGAIYSGSSTLTVTDSTFSGNTANGSERQRRGDLQLRRHGDGDGQHLQRQFRQLRRRDFQ